MKLSGDILRIVESHKLLNIHILTLLQNRQSLT